MSVSITVPFISAFKSNVELLNQQRGSRLRNAVRNESLTGEKGFFEQLGPTRAVRRTSRHGDTPRVDSDHQRRMVTPGDYEWSDLIDQQDRLRLLAEYNSPYAINAANALGRSMDEEIIRAALGTAYTGHDGTNATSFSAGMQVAVNYVESGSAANSGLTIGKLRRARSLLASNNNDPMEEWYIAGTDKQQDDLLRQTETTNIDYNSQRVLVDGKIDSFLGFKFIWTESFQDVPSAFDSTNDINYIFAWRKSGLLLAINDDITTRISERDDKSYATQIYLKATFGATRMQETAIVSIACDRSP